MKAEVFIAIQAFGARYDNEFGLDNNEKQPVDYQQVNQVPDHNNCEDVEKNRPECQPVLDHVKSINGENEYDKQEEQGQNAKSSTLFVGTFIDWTHSQLDIFRSSLSPDHWIALQADNDNNAHDEAEDNSEY